MTRLLAAGIVLSAVLAGSPHGAAAEPSIVASIAPIHGLAAAISEGVARPRLLLPAGASPHSFSLRPSDARAVNRADLVVWVGPALENFLERPLGILAGKDHLLTLTSLKSLTLLKARGTDRDDHEPGHGHNLGSDRHDHADPHGIDPHLWLAPANARAIATAIAERLIRLDAPHATNYRTNLTRTLVRIDRTERDIAVLLAPVQKTRFMTFHDAFQYFERAFGLNSAGWIAVDAARRPSAKRLSALRRTLRDSQARCLFSEPQFPSALMGTVAEGADIRTATLDPLGADIDPGPTHWDGMMLALGRSFRECLLSR